MSQDDNDSFDTGWAKIAPQNVEVDRENNVISASHGEVELATGQEERPCCMCRSFEDVDPAKLIRHVISKGLIPRPDGKFETPIAKDFKGRKSMVLDPKGAGLCRRDVIVVEGLATCENFSPTKTISEFQQRMFKTMNIALDHLLLLGLLCASSHWVLARSKIMQPLWSRATGWLDALLRCAGCSGFWLGLGWRFAGVAVCSGWLGLLMNGLLGAIITPVFEAVLLWGLDMTAVGETPREEIHDHVTPRERPATPTQS